VPYPDSHQDFLALVTSMRELGVVSAFGVVLGPPPTAADRLKAAERKPVSTQEAAEERLRLRREEAREHLRLELAASGRIYSDEQLDEMIGPLV
jgi:hypothetical protein